MAVKKISDRDSEVLKWLIGCTAGQRRKIVLMILSIMLNAAIGVAFALLCRGIVDSAAGGSIDGIVRYGIMLGIASILQLFLQLLAGGLEENVRAKLEMNMRSDMLRELMQREYSAVGRIHSGELLNRMFSDVAIAADGLTVIVPSAVNSCTRIVCAAAVLLLLDKRFALILIVGGITVFLLTKKFRGRIKRLHTDVQEKEGRVRSFLQETVGNLLVIKVFGAENKMLARSLVNESEHYDSRMKRRSISIAANTGLGFVFRAGYIFALIWGAVGIFSKHMSYGTLTAVLQLVNQIQSPFAGLSSLFPRYFGMIASAERIMELERLPEEKPAERQLSYSELQRISLDNVSFSYGESPVLKNVSLDIEKGELISLTGISGGGKSTLFLLLLGAYTQQSGSISFLSENGSCSAGRETRSLFAYVPQGNILFSGTIAENIAFLKSDASKEEILSAAETACAREFIDDLPDGLDTMVGENGFGLSEGQAQRIAIARAILSGAPILLLDEATSALDEAAEARLLKNIASLDGKTVLIVTHRPAALKICSKHLLLKDGKISYEQL
ncbi:MAG: ABC transporter ATP-binding protein [Oscillospiraceae bacterium]|nr:ABC transporter ATP-binding protein [Oscillospiraceae bacterium]